MLPLLLLLPVAVDAVDRLAPDGGASPYAVADDAHIAPGVHALVLESWAKDTLVLRAPDGAIVSSLVAQQLTTTVGASLALGRFELSARGAGVVEDHGRKGIGGALLRPRLGAKVLVVDNETFALGARAALDVGVDATAQALAGATARVVDGAALEPALLASIALPWLKAGVDVGPSLSTRGAALAWAAGASVPVGMFSFGADVYGTAASGHTPVEAALTATAHTDLVDVVAGVGGGLVPDVGTPAARAFAGLSFHVDPWAAPVASSDAQAPLENAPAPAPAPAPAASAPEPAVVAAAAPAAPSVAIVDDEIELDGDVVLFDTDSDKLLPSSFPLLDEVVRVLRAHPEITSVVVEGHADGLGAPAYNKRLSWWRALVVRRYLAGAGVATALDVVAYGQDKPVAPNDTPDGRKKNRRVELHIAKRSAQ